MQIHFYNDGADSESYYQSIEKENLLERLRALASKVHRKGLDKLDPARNRLIRIGMETDGMRVTKSGYGVFDLSWQAAQHREWADTIEGEVEGLRREIHEKHGVNPRFLIWAGMGGSAEDKHAYIAAGLLKHRVHCYVLDSTDPGKLKHILEDVGKRSARGIADALKATLVVGMAMGMTSYEPVVNLQKLAALFDRHRIDGRTNFIYMTLPGSLLDEFARRRGYRRIELQLDNRNSTAGRHSSPLTRGSLYPLALCGADLRAWMAAADLGDDDIQNAWRLAAFLHAEGLKGRDKVTLMLPKEWAGAALWTKQDFEESLGKSEDLGIKIVIDEKIRMPNYRAPKDPRQDRVFLAVGVKGLTGPETQKIALLRRAGYPIATVSFASGTLLAGYMQFVHYVVFGLAWLRDMNFVTQPGVELYKAFASRIFKSSRAWRAGASGVKWRGGVTIYYDHVAAAVENPKATAAEIYGRLLKSLVDRRKVEYGELTFFGDTRYSSKGRAMRTALNRGAEVLFRSALKMPADVYEGPAVNHSYHEMIIGHGRCFSTILISENAAAIPEIGYTADYHRAQYSATLQALAERRRPAVGITVKDLEANTLLALEEFFREAAKAART